MEAQIVAAVRAELQRQAADRPAELSVGDDGAGRLSVEGRIDLEPLAMAIAGSVAGGP